MPLTTNSFTYAGGAQTFTISLGLGYDEATDITVHVTGELDGGGAQIYRTFTFDSTNVVRVTESLDVDDVVVVQRTVSQTTQKVDFENGGDVTPRNIQLQYRHIFQLSQEFLDGRVGLLNPTVDAAAASVSAAAAAVSEAAAAVSAASIDVAKLAGIETAATADQTGAEIKTAYEAEANAYTDTKNTKLGNIETAADVTDATNVAAAGAQMLAETTTAQFLDNTADKLLSTDQVWAAGAEVTLTDEATITVDLDTFINAKVTLTANRALGNPTNEKVGQSGYIRVIQDAGGTNTLSYGTDWEFAGGTAPVLTVTGDAQDILHYVVLAADRILATLTSDIS